MSGMKRYERADGEEILSDFRKGGFKAMQARYLGKGTPTKEHHPELSVSVTPEESDEKYQGYSKVAPSTPVGPRRGRSRSPSRYGNIPRPFSPRPRQPAAPHPIAAQLYPTHTYRPVIYDLSNWAQIASHSSRAPTLIPRDRAIDRWALDRAIRYGLVGGRVDLSWRGRSRKRKRKFIAI